MRPDEVRRAKWRRVIAVLLLFGGIAMVYLVFNASRFEELGDVNAMDYAQIARHVARGDGFITSFIKPISLVFHHSVERHPDLTYPPLHVYWMAGVMRVLGATDRAASHAGGLAFLLTVPLVFLLALRMFDWRTAVLATALFGTHITLLGYAISGLETSLLGLLVTALFLVLHTAAHTERSELPWVVAAGVLMGLIYMTKYIWLVAAIPAIVLVWVLRPQRRLLRTAVFVALIFVVAAPWLYRNYLLTGHPFFTLRVYEVMGHTRANPANTLLRTFRDYYEPFGTFVAANPRALFEKLRSGLAALYLGFHTLGGIFVTPFFVVGLLVRLGAPPLERLRVVAVAMLLLVASALSMVSADMRLLVPVAPVMIVLATVLFWRLLDARLQDLEPRSRQRWTVAAVAILVGLQAFPFLTEITPDEPYVLVGDTPLDVAMRQLQQTTDGPMLTDAPWITAWRADRVGVWLPDTEEDLRRMEEALGGFRWLLLTPEVARLRVREEMQQWANLWVRGQQANPTFRDFEMSARLGDGRYVLMERSADQ